MQNANAPGYFGTQRFHSNSLLIGRGVSDSRSYRNDKAVLNEVQRGTKLIDYDAGVKNDVLRGRSDIN